jgi:hypothetical protein
LDGLSRPEASTGDSGSRAAETQALVLSPALDVLPPFLEFRDAPTQLLDLVWLGEVLGGEQRDDGGRLKQKCGSEPRPEPTTSARGHVPSRKRRQYDHQHGAADEDC